MLSLPTSRVTIVTAKIFTAALRCMALVLMVFVLILGIGAGAAIAGVVVSGNNARTGAAFRHRGINSINLYSVWAGREFYPRLFAGGGGIFLALILGQIVNQIGYGQFYPWMIPMLHSGAAQALSGKTTEPLGFISYLLVLLVGVASIIATGAWWRYADQT